MIRGGGTDSQAFKMRFRNIKVMVQDESMVSFVSSRYMRVVKGSLMVCLAYSNRKTKCQNYRKISRN